MPYIPHTPVETRQMLDTIGVSSIEELFDEIPKDLQIKSLTGIKNGMSEQEISRLMQKLANKNNQPLCFTGAGSYWHHVPAAVWEIAGRGEFLTAYTPYQAEASQGTLQTIYEYQTMMANLMALDISNASMYDGASALAEAILMAVRNNRKSKSRKVLVTGSIHPGYQDTVHNMVKNQKIEIIYLADHAKNLDTFAGEDITAVVIPQLDFCGTITNFDKFTNWAHDQKAVAIALVNPLVVTLLKAPGKWGETGADIACGSGQPLGSPMAAGGPYFGFICCKEAFIRQLPGRIVGRTTDVDGKSGFCLTMQAREQHIRRAKATSNICSNQALMATAATIHMSILGFDGLRNVAAKCHANATTLAKKLKDIPGVTVDTNKPFIHEFVIRLPKPATSVLEKLYEVNIQGGYDLGKFDAALSNCLLVCTTEMHSEDDLNGYVSALAEAIK